MKARLQSVREGIHATTMLLTFAVWLCTLPFVLLVTVPFLGWHAGLGAAAMALVICLLICNAICYAPKLNREDR